MAWPYDCVDLFNLVEPFVVTLNPTFTAGGPRCYVVIPVTVRTLLLLIPTLRYRCYPDRYLPYDCRCWLLLHTLFPVTAAPVVDYIYVYTAFTRVIALPVDLFPVAV